MYFSIILGRVSMGPVLVASRHGGMNIEEVAATDPASVVKVPIDIYSGPTEAQLDRVIAALGLESESVRKTAFCVFCFNCVSKLRDAAREEIKKLYEFFLKHDCTLVEINPFVSTKVRVVCVPPPCLTCSCSGRAGAVSGCQMPIRRQCAVSSKAGL